MLRRPGRHASTTLQGYKNQTADERAWLDGLPTGQRECLSESTLTNIFKQDTVPSISTLEEICTGFHVTLSQFFAEGEMVELTPELKELFDSRVSLTPEQKAAAQQMLRAMNHDK